MARKQDGMTYQQVRAIKEQHTDEFMKNPEVTGIGVGKLPTGEFCIVLYVRRSESKHIGNLPDALEGAPVQVLAIGSVTT